MQIVYFTERPYRGIEEREILRNRAFFGTSNRLFDHIKGSRLYNYYFDEMLYAEALGFDGIALNEHHGTPFCMGGVMNLEAAILARITTTAKIVLIGNALPSKNPLRMAEELATIDLISEGRLISGWVRGSGSEQFFNNINPALNREMFEEAHDIIVQAWSRPGPWRYEGKHYHFRMVNPWTLPYQKPHPPMWIPGLLSPETIAWAAERAYPYVGLGTALSMTCDMYDMYADVAAKFGYQAGSENFGYLVPVVVADTEEQAQEVGAGFVWGGGGGAFSRPEHTLPAGYNSKTAIRRLATQPGGTWLGVSRDRLREQLTDSRATSEVDEAAIKARLQSGYLKQQANYQLVVGTPDSVLPKIRTILEVLRPGALIMFAVQGGEVSDADRMRSLQLTGEVVLPEVRTIASELGLADGSERAPGSVKLRPGDSRHAVVDRERLAAAEIPQS